jgi:hypothetical protein
MSPYPVDVGRCPQHSQRSAYGHRDERLLASAPGVHLSGALAA